MRKITLESQVNRKICLAVEVRSSLKLRWNMDRIPGRHILFTLRKQSIGCN